MGRAISPLEAMWAAGVCCSSPQVLWRAFQAGRCGLPLLEATNTGVTHALITFFFEINVRTAQSLGETARRMATRCQVAV